MSRFLFVYGTLRPEFAPLHLKVWLSSLAVVGRGTLGGRLYDLGAYPGAVPDPLADSTISGIVLETGKSARWFSAPDEYEGVDRRASCRGLFLRQKQMVDLIDINAKIEAWVYVYNGRVNEAKLLSAGVWRWKGASPQTVHGF